MATENKILIVIITFFFTTTGYFLLTNYLLFRLIFLTAKINTEIQQRHKNLLYLMILLVIFLLPFLIPVLLAKSYPEMAASIITYLSGKNTNI